MRPFSETTRSQHRLQSLPVPFLNLLLLLLCAVVFGALSMGKSVHGSCRVFLTGRVGGTDCFAGPNVGIRLTKTGEIFWEGKRISADELTYHAIALRNTDDSARVIISAAVETRLRKVVQVFQALQREHLRYAVETAYVEAE